jgi:Family of unknown function (DUF5681)
MSQSLAGANELMADYEVGYKKPPKHTQFQKGKSGNPGGKRKPTAVTALQRTLSELITIQEQGQTLQVTRLEAALRQMVAKATAGDTAAFRLMSTLIQAYQQPHEAPPKTPAELEEADRKVLAGLMALFRS